MVYGRYIYTSPMDYKPTFTSLGGVPPCTDDEWSMVENDAAMTIRNLDPVAVTNKRSELFVAIHQQVPAGYGQ